MFIRIGDNIINVNQVTCVGRVGKPPITLVYLAGHHDAYDTGGTHSVAIRLTGPEGDAAWDWFCGEVDADDIVRAS